MQELYCKNVFTSVRPFVEECIQSTCLISGGSPYPRMDGKKMVNLLEEGYRMPKPQHVDEKLYEKIVLLLVLFLFLSSYSSNIYFQSSSYESCMRSSKLNQFFFLNEAT